MVFLITSLFAFILKAGGDYNIAGIKLRQRTGRMNNKKRAKNLEKSRLSAL